jgi:hypothetical protein
MSKKYIVTGSEHIDEIRRLISSIELELMPCGDVAKFKPSIMEIDIMLMNIRKHTQKISEEIIKNHGPH